MECRLPSPQLGLSRLQRLLYTGKLLLDQPNLGRYVQGIFTVAHMVF